MELKTLGTFDKKGWHDVERRVYDANGIATTIVTGGGNKETKFLERNDMKKLRIRKLTEGECYRLMGFEEKDTEACREIGQSKSAIYHQAGDSIVTTVLMGIFGEMLGIDYETKIKDYVEKLHEEVEK